MSSCDTTSAASATLNVLVHHPAKCFPLRVAGEASLRCTVHPDDRPTYSDQTLMAMAEYRRRKTVVAHTHYECCVYGERSVGLQRCAQETSGWAASASNATARDLTHENGTLPI
jgi:hypothetical protein